MAIEHVSGKTIFENNAEAVLIFVDKQGKSNSYAANYWPDVMQVVEMMATTNNFNESEVVVFNTNQLKLMATVNGDKANCLENVVGKMREFDIRSINIPGDSLLEAEIIATDLDVSDLVFNICENR
jgi:hypothetical protein